MSALGCGEDPRFRPLIIDVQGLSALADFLIIQLLPAPNAPSCGQVNEANVNSLQAPIRLVWTRTSSSARELAAPSIEADTVTVVAHTETGAGAVLQLGCRQVDYLDIESPEIEIILSRAMR